MGRKLISRPWKAIDAGDMSGSLNGTATDVEQHDSVTYFLEWTGTPTGTFEIQWSNDGQNWYALDFGSTISAAGAAGNHKIDINLITFKYLRPVWNFTAGVGTLDAIVKKGTKGA